MRILHVCDYFHPTIGYQDTFLALAQIEQGHEVLVVTSDRYRPFEDYESSMEPILGPRRIGTGHRTERGISVVRLPVILERHFRCWLRGLPEAVERFSPDLVIVHGVSTSQASRLARLKASYRIRKRREFSLVVDDHMVPDENESVSKRLFYLVFRMLAARTVAREASALVAVSSSTESFMRSHYGFSSREITVIPLGAYTPVFSFRSEGRAALRRQYGYSDSDVVFIYAGKVVPSKGVDLFVGAALQAMARDVRIRVVVVGGGSFCYVEGLKRQIENCGYQDRFQLLPPIANDDLPNVYSMADVGVWPARSSLAMVEAQACGLPIIVSSFPAAAERVSDYNGIVFREWDEDDLARALLQLVDAPTRKEMGRRGRELVLRELDYSVLSDRFIALTESLGPKAH